MDFSVNIYVPYKDGEDFLIQHVSNTVLDQGGLKSVDEIRGCLFSKSFPIYMEFNFLDYIKEVYKNDKKIKLTLKGYINGKIEYYYDIQILKSQGLVFALIKSDIELIKAELNENHLFENSTQAMFVLQNNIIVRTNKYYEQLRSLSKEELLGSTIDYDEFNLGENDIDQFNESSNKILNMQIQSTSFVIEKKKDNNNSVWLNVYLNYTTFNNEPAILVSLEDVTEQECLLEDIKKKNNELTELKENLFHIQSATESSLCYLKNNKVIRTPEFYNILEVEKSEINLFEEIFVDFIIDEEKDEFLKYRNSLSEENPFVNFTTRIKTGKGNIKYLNVTIVYYYDNDGNETLAFIHQDITKQKILSLNFESKSNEALKLKENLDVVLDIAKIAIVYWNIDEGYNWTKEINNILEINTENYNKNYDILSDFVCEDYLKSYSNRKSSVSLEKPVFNKIIEIRTKKNNLKYLSIQLFYSYKDNEIYSAVGYIQDVTINYRRKEKLKQSNQEKEILLKEVHHRVKNNLQIILSLISLDKRFKKENYQEILESTQKRIRSMAIIHENIYSSHNLSNVSLVKYVSSFVGFLVDTYGSNIAVHYDFEDIDLDMNISIPLSLIINEIVSNSLKYAFPNNEKGNIYFENTITENKLILSIYDDGTGLPDGFSIENTNSLGMVIIHSLIDQIDSEIRFLNCDGTGYQITIPLKSNNKQHNALPPNINI